MNDEKKIQSNSFQATSEIVCCFRVQKSSVLKLFSSFLFLNFILIIAIWYPPFLFWSSTFRRKKETNSKWDKAKKRETAKRSSRRKNYNKIQTNGEILLDEGRVQQNWF